MKEANGFSLIELLIVVVIIGIIAAIAIPNLISARRSANESSAISSLRMLHSANATYYNSTSGSYAGTASTPGTTPLNALANASLIDTTLGTGYKSGFNFTGSWEPSSSTSIATFYFSANPAVTSGVMLSGARRFGLATDGVIKVDVNPANLGVPFDFASLAAAQPSS